MRLKTINIDGVKGRLSQVDLAPATILVGRSFTGKTALLDGLVLALLGYHPNLGNKPGLTMKLAAGDSMTVQVEAVDGTNWSRCWERGKRGTVTTKAMVPGWEMPALAFSPTQFFALSGPGRIERLLRLVDMSKSEWTTGRVVVELGAVQVDGDAAVVARSRLVEELECLAKSAEEEDATLVQWVDAAADALKNHVARATVNVEAHRGHLRSGAVVDDTLAVADVGEALARAREALEVALAGQTALQTAEDGWRRWTAHRADLVRQAGTVDEQAALAADLARQRADLARRERDLEEMVEVDLVPVWEGLGRIRTDLATAREKANQLAAELNATKRQMAELEELTCCPYCQGKSKGWKKALDAVLSGRLAEITAEGDAAAELVQRLAAADSEQAGNLQAVQRIQAIRDKLVREYQDASVHLTQAQTRLDQVERAAKLLADLGPEAERPGAEALAGALLAVGEARATVGALEVRDRAWQAHLARERAAARGLKALEEAEAILVAARGMGKRLVTVREKLVAAGMQQFLEPVHHMTDGILPGRILWEDGDLGYRADLARGGNWISHETMSGTEQAVVYAGLAVALAGQSRLRLVLIDELGVMDPGTRLAVVERMAALVQDGTIDQFIGCDANHWPAAPEGVTIVEVEE